MLAHKTGPRNGTFSGISFLVIGALALAGLVLVAPRLTNGSPSVTASSDSFSSYHNNDFNYSISYPSNWKVAPVVPNTNVTTIASQLAQPEQAGGRYSIKSLNRSNPTTVGANNFSKIDVVTYELEDNLSAFDFLAAKSKGAVDGNISNIKIAGQDALLLEVQTAQALAQREENLLYKSVFVTKGNHGFIIAGFADADTFNRILQSFQID